MNLPPPKELSGDHDDDAVPYVFVGDEAFPMKTYLLQPYPGWQLDADYKSIQLPAFKVPKSDRKYFW